MWSQGNYGGLKSDRSLRSFFRYRTFNGATVILELKVESTTVAYDVTQYFRLETELEIVEKITGNVHKQIAASLMYVGKNWKEFSLDGITDNSLSKSLQKGNNFTDEIVVINNNIDEC